MKKVIFGSFLTLSGMISTAILLAFGITKDWIIDDNYSVVWNLTQYGLIPILVCFIAVAVLGVAIALWGMFEK